MCFYLIWRLLCIIGAHKLNNIRYADDIVLIVDTERKLQNNHTKGSERKRGETSTAERKNSWLLLKE